MRNQISSKEIAATKMEKRKRGRPCKRWRDEVEEDLDIMGNKQVADSCYGTSVMKEDCVGNQD
jgi:hypothetical protein